MKRVKEAPTRAVSQQGLVVQKLYLSFGRLTSLSSLEVQMPFFLYWIPLGSPFTHKHDYELLTKVKQA